MGDVGIEPTNQLGRLPVPGQFLAAVSTLRFNHHAHHPYGHAETCQIAITQFHSVPHRPLALRVALGSGEQAESLTP